MTTPCKQILIVSARNEHGSSLIALLATLGVIGFIMMELMFSGGVAKDRVATANIQLSALNLKSSLMTYFRNDASWARIRDDNGNTSLACLRPGSTTPCTEAENVINVVRDAANTELYTASGTDAGSKGFSLSGEPCVRGSAGDPMCPFSVEITWKAQCDVYPCVLGAVRGVVVRATVVYVGSSDIPYNKSKYAFALPRAP